MADDLTTLALCWRIERRDGVAVALTDHDRDLRIDGIVHQAAPGMTPSAISRSDGLEADTMDVGGALTAAAITERDLTCGRWDGARVALFAVDWAAGGDPIPLGEGTVGAVETRNGGFTAELSGPTAALAAPVVEETSPDCRAELGDKRCRVPMAARRRHARVVAADDLDLTVDASAAENAYAGGVLRWLGGANSGFTSFIAGSNGATVTLRSLPAFAIEPGVLVELSDGCDKSIATCAGRFGNVLNFRGEPYLPGIDLLTRYPGA